jgi:hypothetical protein
VLEMNKPAMLGAMMAGLAAAEINPDWGRVSEMKLAVERRYRARWMPRKRRENPAGTKLARQAAAGACTLRGRVPNGAY